MVIYTDTEKAGSERVVYFAQRNDGAVKIGTTRRLSGRRKELEFLLGKITISYVYASSRFESLLHKKYLEKWLHNETFNINLEDLLKDVENNYKEEDFMQKENKTRKTDNEINIPVGFTEEDQENIKKIKMFVEFFGSKTYTDIYDEYLNNLIEYGFQDDMDGVEDKIDLVFRMYEPKMPKWLVEVLLDYSLEEIEHEYILSIIIKKCVEDKKQMINISYLSEKVQELESKIAGFIEVSDTRGKDDKQIYQMVKEWLDK